MVFRRVALAGLLLAVGACTSIRQVQTAQYILEQSPDVVWVTYTNNALVPVAEPRIAGDTLRGMRQGTQRPVAIPLGQVRRVQAKVPDPTKTVILLTALGVAAASSVYFVFIRQAGPRPDGTFCGYDLRSDAIPYC
jgi:hypothetical protein